MPWQRGDLIHADLRLQGNVAVDDDIGQRHRFRSDDDAAVREIDSGNTAHGLLGHDDDRALTQLLSLSV